MAKIPLVQSINRALDILELLSREEKLGITQIGQAVELDKTTVFRIVQTLCVRGYIRQDPSNQMYSNTLKLFQMGAGIVDRRRILGKARPHLEALAISTRETVNLAVIDGGNIVYVDKIESTEVIKADLGVGKSYPAYATSLGKSILALLGENELERLYRGDVFSAFTQHTVKNLDELKKQLKKVRAKGYASDDEELVTGLSCVAAAIRDFQGKPVAAVSIAFPSYRVLADSPERSRMAELVQMTARSISIELGFRE
ncbi:MAG TPA: IclR family transcriptional regulator [Synergistales bacterium]|nr:IclR family transcriptional regulator [Synergistales bacterium]